MLLLDHTCEIQRRQKIEGKGLSSHYATVATGVRCLALPATNQNTLSPDIVVGQDYVAYFEEDADVKEGDKLIVSTGITLLVKGIAPYKGLGGVSHLELACSTQGV